MYSYRKRFFYPIHVEKLDPVLAKLLLDHYGGKYGELTQVVQYLNHQVNIDNRYVRELLGLITAEELAHLETLSAMIIKLGGEVKRLTDHKEAPWTLTCVNQYSELEKVLRANITLEKKARIAYEDHAAMAQDPGVKRLLSFLARREAIHHKLLIRCHKALTEGGTSEQYMEIIYDYKMSLQVLD